MFAMAQRWYIGNGKLVDVLGSEKSVLSDSPDARSQERCNMPLSDVVPNQFEEWMDQCEAGARQGAHERFGNVCSVDPEQLYSEDRLGCARGMVWAFGFQAVLLIAIGAYWMLRFLLR
jgi:hypothetical protein